MCILNGKDRPLRMSVWRGGGGCVHGGRGKDVCEDGGGIAVCVGR